MITKEIITKEIDFLDQTKDLCLSYEQISMMRMNEIKKRVLTTRTYYENVADVYRDIRRIYKKQISVLEKKQEGTKKSKLSLFLSANNKLYGDILNKVFKLFVSEISKEETDIIIVGSLGKNMYESAVIDKPYTYIELPHADSKITLTDLYSIIKTCADYKSVTVYFGKYESYISQKAEMANITGDVFTADDSSVSETVQYFFEPSLEKIILYFESQMTSALLKQSVYEGQLARYASRIGSMEEALHAIRKANYAVEMQKRKIIGLEKDKKQNEQIVQLFYRN